jgi:glycosyltransferase involved in cell wall biosynthesis
MVNPWEEVDIAGERLLELEVLFRPDVVHLNGYAHAALVWNRPVLVVAHSCVCSWFDKVKGSEIPIEFNEYKKRVIEGLACADHVVAPSYDMLNQLNKHYGHVTRSSVIYNGISTLNSLKTKKENLVLTAGRIWDEGKNIGVLARIASQLDWEVYAAGEGDVNVINYKNFKPLGKLSQSELFAYMMKASVFVLPSKYEPFGLSILEAARAGCALVLGDIPSLREIWENDAIFIDPNDAVQIRNSIQELINNEPLRNEYANRAKKRAQKYTAEKMAQNYLGVYESLLGQNNSSQIHP